MVPLPGVTSGRLPISVQSLVKALHMYQLRPAPGPISLDTLPHVDAGTAAVPAAGYGYDACVAAEGVAAGKAARRRDCEAH